MSAIGYAVLPTTVSLRGIGQTLSREFNAPAAEAGRKAAEDMGKSLVDGAKQAAGEVAKARKSEEEAADRVATAEQKLADQRSKAERDARAIESAELKLTAAREKGTADVTKAENDLAAARDAGDVDAITDAESKLAQTRARTDATVIDRENALDRARQTSEASARKVASAEEDVAVAKDGAAEASENVLAATKRYDDALDGSADSAVDLSDELRQLQDDLAGTGDELDSAASEVAGFGQKLRDSLSTMATGALLGIGADIGRSVMSGIRDAVSGGWQSALDIDTGTRVLEGLYDSSEAAQEMLMSLREVSARSPIDHSSYLEASQALAYTGVQGEQAIQIMENVGLAALASGKDGDQAFSTMNDALARMVNEGRVGMDSLNQLSSAGVPILSGLAEHFGVSMEEVNQMSRDGAIEFEDVLSVMENATGGYFENALVAGEEASASLENQLARLKDNLTTGVGEAIAPLLAEMDFEAIGDTVGDLAATVLPMLTGAFSGLFDVLSTGVDLFSQLVGWVQENQEWLIPLAATVGTYAGALVGLEVATLGVAKAKDLAAIATEGFSKALGFMKGHPVIAAIAAVVGGLVWFFTQTETGQELWDSLMESLGVAADWMRENLAPLWDSITEAWSVAMEWISEKFTEIGEGIGQFYETWIAPLVGWFAEAGEGMSGFGETILGALRPVVDFFVDVFVLHIQNAWNLVSTAISSVWENIIRPVFDTFRSIIGLVTDIATGNFGNIGTRFSELGENLRRVVMGPINVAKDLFVAIWENVGRSFDFFRDKATEVMGAVRERIDSVVEFIRDLPGTIKGFFSDAGSWLVDAGKNIVEGLLNGIRSLAGTIGSFFLDLLPGWMVEPFKLALGIESPSTVFADFGRDIGQGLVDGLESMTGAVSSAAAGIGDEAAAAAAASIPDPSFPTSVIGPIEGPGLPSAPPAAAPAPVPFADQSGQEESPGGIDGAHAGLAGAMLDEWSDVGDGLTAVKEGVLDPVMAGHVEGLEWFGAVTTEQLGDVVTPAWGAMSAGLDALKLGLLDPIQAGLREQVTATATQTHESTLGSMLPDWQNMGAGVNAVQTGVIDPAMAATRGAIENTRGAFATGTTGMINEWNRLREGVASPVRYAIGPVFNDGLVGMWNSVAEMVGLDPMRAHPINFWAGGVLPGYTPGRDPFMFVEPQTGMSIGLSGGESIMRPEWTRAVGPAGVEAMNAAARRGGVDEVRRLMAPHGGSRMQFSSGGIFGGPHIGDFSQGAVIDSMTNFVNRFFPELTLTSGWRFTDSGYHSRGLAGDYSNQVSGGPPTAASIGLANAIYRNFAGQTAQLIHAPLQGWQNLLHGIPHNYGAVTDRQHWDHVHWALERPLMAAGTDLDLSGGIGVVVDPREIVESMIGDDRERVKGLAHGFSGTGGGIDALPGAIHDTLIEPMIDTLVEAFETFGGDPGGADVSRWRPLAMQALARHGYDAGQYIDAMMEQIRIESGGNPAAINLWDSNAAAGHPSGGLLQVIRPTYDRVRNAYPDAFVGLPWDHMHPLSNLTAGVGAVTLDWGGPGNRWPTRGGYDQGGWLPPTPGGFGTYFNHTGAPEPVFTAEQWALLREQLGLNIDLVEELRRFVLVVNRDDDDRDELAAQAVYDVFGREPMGPDLHKVLHAGPRAWQETAAHLEHIAATGDYLENEWFSESSQLAEAARAVARGRVGFDEWASASEDQDRMGSPEEFAQHYGQQLGAEMLDGALGMVGLDGIIGGQWSQSIRDFAEVGGWDLPGFGPDPILDDEGRALGTRLEQVEAAVAEADEAATATATETVAAGQAPRQPITIVGDSIPADQVEELLDRVEGVEFEVTRIKGERASITTRKVLA